MRHATWAALGCWAPKQRASPGLATPIQLVLGPLNKREGSYALKNRRLIFALSGLSRAHRHWSGVDVNLHSQVVAKGAVHFETHVE